MADQSHKQAPPLPPSEDEITKASTGGADPHPTAIEDAGPSNEGGDTAGEGNELPLLPEDAGEPEEDIDPLILAQQEAERREKELAQAADIAQNDDPALKVRHFLCCASASSYRPALLCLPFRPLPPSSCCV